MFRIDRRGTVREIKDVIVEGPDYSVVTIEEDGTFVVPNHEVHRVSKTEAKAIAYSILRNRYGEVGDLVVSFNKYDKSIVERTFIVTHKTDRCLYGLDDSGEFKYSVDNCIVIQKKGQ
jgi:hypothetical protein